MQTVVIIYDAEFGRTSHVPAENLNRSSQLADASLESPRVHVSHEGWSTWCAHRHTHKKAHHCTTFPCRFLKIITTRCKKAALSTFTFEQFKHRHDIQYCMYHSLTEHSCLIFDSFDIENKN
uniref:Uncharacterized protein n=1 Tax=Physcomitrium patens TaxID=3218 RepID=A0A2K1KNQ3_PHYPA|nr:hypothetical protein PHYPA_006306 [Physcomitrium patens]